jgi:polyisoprenoid-binding protein YceI
MLDAGNLNNKPQAKILVNMASLKTGIEMRDEHMRSPMYLDTKKYEFSSFELESFSNLSATELGDMKKITGTVNGKLTIHGVTKSISAPVTLTYFKGSKATANKLPGNLLKITTEFSVALSDYNITRPETLVYKLDENIKINISIVTTDKDSKMGACNPCATCNPCGMKMKGKCNPCGMKKKAKCNPCSPKL